MHEMTVTLSVNGQPPQATVEPGMTLADPLREAGDQAADAMAGADRP
jgi:aerobic-type carbon monoxide dehydrogenase small subunit (CoxS/CutS family)